MRLGLNSFSADDAINKLDQQDLSKIFKFFGDEKDSKKIAKAIIKKRDKNIISSEDLNEIVNREKKITILKLTNLQKYFSP